jgi:hypothetical protein
MLLYYITGHTFSLAALYDFAVRWVFFNLAAPSLQATYGAGGTYMGDFPPGLMGYFNSPVSTGMVALFAAVVAVSVLPRHRGAITREMAGLMLGVSAYAVLRALFFFLIYPGEYMLFASAVSLPHLLLIAVPFAASTYPHKHMLLAGLAALLFVVNGSFILGP